MVAEDLVGVVDVRELEGLDHADALRGDAATVAVAGELQTVAFRRGEKVGAALVDDVLVGALDGEDVAVDLDADDGLALGVEGDAAVADAAGGIVEVEEGEDGVGEVAGLVDEEVLGEGPDVEVAAGLCDGDAELLLRGAVGEGGVAAGDARERGVGRRGVRVRADLVGEGEVRAEGGEEELVGGEGGEPALAAVRWVV